MRAIFIAAGAALLNAFSIMFAVFGLVLAGTAIQLFRHRNEDHVGGRQRARIGGPASVTGHH
jgi:predicted tellurium resistance membrane protein TerC